MDMFPREQPHPSIFEEKVESVNSLYGPGTLLSWILAAVSLLYDANSSQSTFEFDGADWITWIGGWLKYAALWFLGLWALIEAIVRALHQDFGPSYAAALYVSDKAFEVATLYYCVKTFGIHRRDKAKRDKAADKKPEEAETGRYVRPVSLICCVYWTDVSAVLASSLEDGLIRSTQSPHV
jgi:hypothetical protein